MIKRHSADARMTDHTAETSINAKCKLKTDILKGQNCMNIVNRRRLKYSTSSSAGTQDIHMQHWIPHAQRLNIRNKFRIRFEAASQDIMIFKICDNYCRRIQKNCSGSPKIEIRIIKHTRGVFKIKVRGNHYSMSQTTLSNICRQSTHLSSIWRFSTS